MRANNSGWRNEVTVTAFDQGKVVATDTENLKPLGDGSQITLSAPAIDSVSWSGEGWVFHPYYVTGLELKIDGQSVGSGVGTPAISTPNVGSPVPEPGTSTVMIFFALSVLRRQAANQFDAIRIGFGFRQPYFRDPCRNARRLSSSSISRYHPSKRNGKTRTAV